MAAGNRDLVVIGGSAGASAPLRSILSSLPQDLPAAVLVVMHVPSTGEGVFPTLSNLPSPAALPVQNAEDGGELRTGRIYIAPPNRHLLIFGGHLKLGTGPRENLVRPAELAEAVLRFVAEPPGPAREVPEDIRFEVEVAAGGRIDHDRLGAFAEASSITCPDCGGVLSEVHGNGPLRFRCQVGHAFTGGALVERQEGLTDEAMRVALRIIEERAALVGRMAREAGRVGRTSMAEMYDRRVEEYRASADVLRKAIGRMMNTDGQADPAESAADEDTAR